MKKVFLTAAGFILVYYGQLAAQTVRFPESGIIEFEKTINIYAVIDQTFRYNEGGIWQKAIEQYKAEHPQFKKLTSKLQFAGSQALFTPGEDPEPQSHFTNNPVVDQPNTVFSDFSTGMTITQKNVFDEWFLVKDSLRQIRWKLTAETRNIAGYTCRRANALLLDSVYAVAFYTDEIHLSGGPESFGGLPGMILGLALPHKNITWFATRVLDIPVSPESLRPPKKGKPTSYEGLKGILKATMKNWGEYGETYRVALLL